MSFQYGFDAISKHNGWEISFLGIIIVFIGLSLLAFAISRLHLILSFFEKHNLLLNNKEKNTSRNFFLKKRLSKKNSFSPKIELINSYKQYSLLKDFLNSPIALPLLLELAEKRGISHAHSALSDLLQAEVLKADGEGFYLWDNSVFKEIVDSDRYKK